MNTVETAHSKWMSRARSSATNTPLYKPGHEKGQVGPSMRMCEASPTLESALTTVMSLVHINLSTTTEFIMMPCGLVGDEQASTMADETSQEHERHISQSTCSSYMAFCCAWGAMPLSVAVSKQPSSPVKPGVRRVLKRIVRSHHA